MVTSVEAAQLKFMSELIAEMKDMNENLNNIDKAVTEVVEELLTLNERESMKNLQE